MCVCVCLGVHTCMCMCIYVYIYLYIYVYAYMHICPRVDITINCNVQCASLHNELQCVFMCIAACGSVLQCVAVCCSVLQCVVVCCSVLQCAAVCCSTVYHATARDHVQVHILFVFHLQLAPAAPAASEFMCVCKSEREEERE